MKRILSTYIIREISSLFLLGLLIFTLILLMTRLLSLTDMVVSHGVPMVDVVKMVFYLIPSFLVLTIPMAFLLAVLLTFGRLSADNEIVVIKACGISLFQMIPPVIFCAVITLLLALVSSTIAVPYGNSAFKKLSFQVLTRNITATIREKTFWGDIPGVVMYAEHYDEISHNLKGVIIHDGRNSDRQMTIFAKQGLITTPLDSQTLLLSLQDGSIHTDSAKGVYRLVNFGEYNMTVGEKGGKGEIARNETDMWLSELDKIIYDSSTPAYKRLKILSEYHSRFTFPFASLVFAILAVPLGIQNRRSGKSAGFTISIAIILTYYVLMSFVRILAEKGTLPPVIALWIPNLVFLLLGFYLLHMASMEKNIPIWSFKKMLDYFGKSS